MKALCAKAGRCGTEVAKRNDSHYVDVIRSLCTRKGRGHTTSQQLELRSAAHIAICGSSLFGMGNWNGLQPGHRKRCKVVKAVLLLSYGTGNPESSLQGLFCYLSF